MKTMKKILKVLFNHLVWIIAILILLSVILTIQQPFYKWVALFAGLVFSPFIGLLNKYLTKRNLEIWGLPFKEFITAWITFLGIIGIAGGIVQVQRQIMSNDKQVRDTRFAAGVKLLGNQNESARIGGAYSLYFLASEHPDEFLNPVCEILCAHIRTITDEKEYQEKYSEKPSNETQTIINLLFKKEHDKLIFDEYSKNLAGTFLCGVSFTDAVLSNVDFKSANLRVSFWKAKLSNIRFDYATLICSFQNATLNNVEFFGATLRDVSFTEATLSNVRFRCDVTLDDVDFLKAKLSDVIFSNVVPNFPNARIGGFSNPALNNVSFKDATFSDVNFWDAQLKENIDFSGTNLEGYKFEDITRHGFTLEKTKSEESTK
jgi:uncharacterized protein YjbI with pentapeptide repeats